MGIRKVNLSDLAGSLSQRGRDRYTDPELHEAFVEAIGDGGSSFIWETAVIEGKTEKAKKASQAKWRNRAVSVFTAIAESEGMKLSVRWTVDNECLLIVAEQES